MAGISYGLGHTQIGGNQPAQQFTAYDNRTGRQISTNSMSPQDLDRSYGGGDYFGYGAGYSSGGGMGGGGGFGGGMGGGGINDLLQRQMTENASAKSQNQANWTGARDYLLGQQARYDSNPVVGATRGMVSNLLANPESLDDRTVGQIQNNASSGIIARMNQMQDQGAGILAAGGQSDAASLAALNERIGNAGGAQLAGVSRDVGIQRAQQRRGDELNAIGAGMRQGQQDTGVGMQIAQSYLGGLPQYMPDDYSGLIAGMQQFQGQGGGNAPGQFTRTGGFGGQGIGGSGKQNNQGAIGLGALGGLSGTGQYWNGTVSGLTTGQGNSGMQNSFYQTPINQYPGNSYGNYNNGQMGPYQPDNTPFGNYESSDSAYGNRYGYMF